MKINKSELQSILAIASSGVAKKASLSILECVRLKTDGDILTIEATDLRKFVTASVSLPDRGEGMDWLLPHSVLNELVDTLPSGEIVIESAENGVKIRCASHKHNLRGMNSDDWPVFDMSSPVSQADIDQSVLKDSLTRCNIAAANEKQGGVLSGVFIGSIGGGDVIMCAADGFRAARVISPALSPLSGKSVIIPIQSATELLRLLGDTGSISVSLCETRVIFKTGVFTFVTQLVDGNYPDVSPIIDIKPTVQCVCGVDDVIPPVRAVSIFARMSSTNSVIVSFDLNGLRVSSESSESGDSDVPIPVESVGGEIQFSCNPYYLLDALRVCSGKVKISTSGSMRPIVIEEIDNDSFKYVLMPTYRNGQE